MSTHSTENLAYSLGSSEHEESRLQGYVELFGQKRLLAQVRTGMSVLDVGCGAGSVSALLAGAAGPSGQVVGVDMQAEQVERAQARAEEKGLANLSFQTADALQLPFEDASFDLVYEKFLLLHLSDPTAALREMHRVLRPGGTLFVYEFDADGAQFWPAGIPAERAWGLVNWALTDAGADVTIGRKLFQMLTDLGLTDLHIKPEASAACAAHPRILKGSVLQLTGVLETMRERIVEGGQITSTELDALIAATHEMAPGDLFTTTGFAAWGTKPPA